LATIGIGYQLYRLPSVSVTIGVGRATRVTGNYQHRVAQPPN